jgi:branched-chain amino acid transport system substrate-binding protein
MTGPQAPFGKEAERGIQLALEAVKAADPGAQWTLAIGDDGSSAKQAGTAADTLVTKDKVNVLLGDLTGPATIELAEVAKAKQRPLVVPLTTAAAVQSGPMVARAAFDEPMQGAILGEFAVTALGVKKAGVLRDDSATAQAIAAAFEQAVKARGGSVEATEVYDLAGEDYSVPLKALAAKGVKHVLLPASYQTAAAVMRQAKTLGLGLTFLGTEAWDTPRFTAAATDAGQGHYFVTHFATDDKDAAAFVAAFKAKFGREPGSIAALAYDGTMLLAEAVKRSNSNQAPAVMAELAKIKDYAGVTGVVTHDGAGNFLKSGIVKATTLRGADFKARVMPAGKA